MFLMFLMKHDPLYQNDIFIFCPWVAARSDAESKFRCLCSSQAIVPISDGIVRNAPTKRSFDHAPALTVLLHSLDQEEILGG